MKLVLNEERFEFDFPQAISLYKFDERDPMSPHYHNTVMKAVDVMAEFPNFQLWIEIKEYTVEQINNMKAEGNQKKNGDDYHLKTWLLGNVKYKFRDTFLYRYCENKIPEKIVYIFLTNFDDALNSFFRKELIKHIPAIKITQWSKTLLEKDHILVVNKEAWERNLENRFGICRKL